MGKGEEISLQLRFEMSRKAGKLLGDCTECHGSDAARKICGGDLEI